jgi:hypothetical protein
MPLRQQLYFGFVGSARRCLKLEHKLKFLEWKGKKAVDSDRGMSEAAGAAATFNYRPSLWKLLP